MARQVIVDDTDPQIQYTGRGWFSDSSKQNNVGNLGPTYMRTLHRTMTNGSFSFSFSGTSVSIFGTTDNKTQLDPVFKCSVDQLSIGLGTPLKFPENNWLLCGQKTLNDSPHVVTLNVTTTGNTFWLDYLTYTPSPTVTLDKAVLLVDDNDSAFLFGTGWGSAGDAVMTDVAGSRVKFDFIGTSVSWVGYVPQESSHAAASGSFVIDNSKPINFILNGLPSNEMTSQYNQIFFVTPDLAPGPHSLVVTYNGGNGPSTPLTLDYLYVNNTSIPQPANVAATSSAAPLSPSASGGSQGDTDGHRLSKNPPVGAIIGGIIGGLSLICLILLLLRWLRLRRRRREVGMKLKRRIGKGEMHGVTPFVSAQPETSMYGRGNRALSAHPPAPPFAISLPSTISHPGNQSRDSYPVSVNFSIPSASVPPSTLSNNISHAEGYSYRGGRSQSTSHAHTTSLDSSNVSGYGTGTIHQPRALRMGQIEPSILSVLQQDSESVYSLPSGASIS